VQSIVFDPTAPHAAEQQARPDDRGGLVL